MLLFCLNLNTLVSIGRLQIYAAGLIVAVAISLAMENIIGLRMRSILTQIDCGVAVSLDLDVGLFILSMGLMLSRPGDVNFPWPFKVVDLRVLIC